MTSRDFCYWLQGLFELSETQMLDTRQTRLIRDHLKMVFLHEIDPSFPDDQKIALDHIHHGGHGPNVQARC